MFKVYMTSILKGDEYPERINFQSLENAFMRIHELVFPLWEKEGLIYGRRTQFKLFNNFVQVLCSFISPFFPRFELQGIETQKDNSLSISFKGVILQESKLFYDAEQNKELFVLYLSFCNQAKIPLADFSLSFYKEEVPALADYLKKLPKPSIPLEQYIEQTLNPS